MFCSHSTPDIKMSHFTYVLIFVLCMDFPCECSFSFTVKLNEEENIFEAKCNVDLDLSDASNTDTTISKETNHTSIGKGRLTYDLGKSTLDIATLMSNHVNNTNTASSLSILKSDEVCDNCEKLEDFNFSRTLLSCSYRDNTEYLAVYFPEEELLQENETDTVKQINETRSEMGLTRMIVGYNYINTPDQNTTVTCYFTSSPFAGPYEIRYNLNGTGWMSAKLSIPFGNLQEDENTVTVVHIFPNTKTEDIMAIYCSALLWNATASINSDISGVGDSALSTFLMHLKFLDIISYAILTICTFGIVGNSLCIAVLLLCPRALKLSTRILLCGLQMADLIVVSVCFYMTLQRVYSWSDRTNEEYVGRVLNYSKSVTNYFTIAITAERFIAISYPLKAQKILKVRNAIKWTILVWLLPLLFRGLVESLRYVVNESNNEILFAAFTPVFQVGIPILVVSILNFVNYRVLRTQSLLRKDKRGGNIQEKEAIALAKMIFFIALVFVLSNILQITIMVGSYAILYPGLEVNVRSIILAAYGLLASLFCIVTNSSTNFIFYVFCGKKFRKGLADLVTNCFRLKRNDNDKRKHMELSKTSQSSNLSNSIDQLR